MNMAFAGRKDVVLSRDSIHRHKRTAFWIFVSIAFLIALAVYATLSGTSSYSLSELYRLAYAKLLGVELTREDERLANVLLQLRLPRVLLAIFAGAILSLSGAAMQGLLRNPLVSPYTLGLSPAAAFGAALAILVAQTNGTSVGITISLSAIAFSLACSLIVLGLASAKSMNITVLILLGTALTAIFSALTSGLQYIANDEALAAITRWTFGSVNEARWTHVVVLAATILVITPYFQLKAGQVNSLAFAGDDTAKSLGVNVNLLRISLIFLAVSGSSLVVSFIGVVGFVGLVAPHIARLIVGSDHRFLFPFSMVTGGGLLLLADTVGRMILPPRVIPVGIVVALVGAPLFIYLILRKRNTL
ncbi:iron ABC transporter permease [Rhizobium sp. CG4]|jgi:iron complex transport system permease protein|uniref:FecCD family ABC transporter permease n=1 Tax=unclassified Rhizobium TaxID=2613769 RepID=UPI0020348B7A|nr:MULTISPECIES: iron ABC transporter permease [unclassified Rhizobium]MCM2458747.1 iron ABC transporter permease [Rhizobium sp. CG4]MCS4245122.1 iron complex transport system permease protein [Rhizobium sp. BIGb0125]